MKVDKSKWVKKTLGDCFDLQMGKTPSRKNLDLWKNGDTPWVSISDMKDVKFISETKELLSSSTIKDCNIPIVPSGTVIMSFKLSIGKTCITACPLTTNEAVMAFYPKRGYSFDKTFLYYFLPNLKWKSNRAVKGKTINKKTISQKEFVLPPLPEQQGIATELDAIQKMIDGYKAQLAELNTLVQSIFLDMFGDPISNSKVWETNCFEKLFKLKSGDSLPAKKMVIGPYPVYGGNGKSGNNNAFNKCGEYVLIGRVGAYCGNVRLVNGKFWLTDNAFELVNKTDKFINRFLLTLLKLLNLGRKAHKVAQPVISNVGLKDVKVIVPPLTLQQRFAAQVEAIEEQKELICQQLADAEMLMAERMQYYFS